MIATEEHLGRVQAVVWALTGTVRHDELARVQRMADHGEPAEAMVSLAWIVVFTGTTIPAWTVTAIRELAGGELNAGHLPPDLDRYAGADPEIDLSSGVWV